MLGKTLSFLMAICKPCHLAVTFDANGERRPFKEVFEWTMQLLNSDIKELEALKVGEGRYKKPICSCGRPKKLGRRHCKICRKKKERSHFLRTGKPPKSKWGKEARVMSLRRVPK